MTAHTDRAHARLAPSASKRFMMCAGSIRMSQGIPNTSSTFADEGTAAHELASHVLSLSASIDCGEFEGMWVNLEGKTAAEKFIKAAKGKRCHEIDAEMVDGVQTYVDLCRGLTAHDVESDIEQWLSLEYLKIPGLDGGTGDFVAYNKTTQVLEVVDLKYGRGVPVEPKDNTQGLCYALGAIRRYHNRGIAKLRITIVQPRCPHPAGPVRTWEADVIDLLDFEADLREAALRTMEKDAPLLSGEWCKFCPAAPTCPARRDHALSIAQAEFSAVGELELPVVTALEPEKLAEILLEVGQVEDWCRRVKEHAHNEAVHGRTPPGFKLVAKRATRRWKDDASIPETLEDLFGLDKAQIYAEPELLSPAKIEPLMPGKNKVERAKKLADLCNKESSGTVLAPAADPRPAVKADASEFGEVA